MNSNDILEIIRIHYGKSYQQTSIKGWQRILNTAHLEWSLHLHDFVIVCFMEHVRHWRFFFNKIEFIRLSLAFVATAMFCLPLHVSCSILSLSSKIFKVVCSLQQFATCFNMVYCNCRAVRRLHRPRWTSGTWTSTISRLRFRSNSSAKTQSFSDVSTKAAWMAPKTIYIDLYCVKTKRCASIAELASKRGHSTCTNRVFMSLLE